MLGTLCLSKESTFTILAHLLLILIIFINLSAHNIETYLYPFKRKENQEHKKVLKKHSFIVSSPTRILIISVYL